MNHSQKINSHPKGVLCECIDTGQIHIESRAGKTPVFLLTLETESGKTLCKFLNFKLTLKGSCTVGHDSDFAKLYRLTLGENPVKRFSKAKQLLSHFRGYSFFAEYKPAAWSNGSPFLKVTSLQPVDPRQNNDWTGTGKLRKKSRKRPDLKQKNDGNEVEISRKSNDENIEKEWKNNGNEKTLEPAETLGLEPIFNPTYNIPAREEPCIQYPTSCPSAEKILISDTETLFIHRQLEGESLPDYYDRVVNQTFFI